MSEPTGARRYGTGGGDAYYDAVKYGGYEGTREQFGKDQAEFAKNATAVAAAKEVVEQDTEEVQSTKNTFVNITVPEAIAAVQQEGADQVQAVTQQGEESSQQVEAVGTQWQDTVANEGRARVQAVEQAGTDQVQAVNDAGAIQVGAVNQAGEAQIDAVEQAGADQVQAVTDEGTTQVGAVTGEGNTQVQRVQDKGDEVIDSIPADYSALDQNVTNLKSAFDDSVDRFDDELHSFSTFESGGAPVLGRLDTATDIDSPATTTARAVLSKFTIQAPSSVAPNPTALAGNYGVTLSGVSSFPTTFRLYRQKNGVLEFIKTLTSSYVIDDVEAEYRIELIMTGFSNNSTPKLSEIISNSDIAAQIYVTVSQADRTRLDEIEDDLSLDGTDVSFTVDGYVKGHFFPETGQSSTSQNYFRSSVGIPYHSGDYIMITNRSTDGLVVTAFTSAPSFTSEADNSSIYASSQTVAAGASYTFQAADGLLYYVDQHTAFASISTDVIPEILCYSKLGGRLVAIEEQLDSLEGITPYREEERTFIAAVNAARDANKIVAVLSTDNHYNDADSRDCNQVRIATAISKLAKAVNADLIINLGDIIEGYNDALPVADYNYQYVNYNRLSQMIDALYTARIPIIYAAGHHEMFPIADTYDGATRTENRGFPMRDVYRLAFGEMDNLNSQTGFRGSLKSICTDDDPTNSLSFYFDLTKGSGTVRFLTVDGVDYGARGYSSGTIQFVTDALTDAKSNNIPVIMMCHIPPVSNGVINGAETPARNEEEYNAAIDAVGADIIAYFYGHIHHDNIITGLKSYPLVGFDCQKLYRRWSVIPEPMYGDPSCPARAVGTYSEYAFDAVVIDTETHEIDCYRFGAGDTGTYPTRSIGG